MAPIRVARRDQTYEGDESELPEGMAIEDVICGTCGEGGDEDRLMLCDGCDAGHHCFCVGLDAVPLEEWRCRICAETNAPLSDGQTALRDVDFDALETVENHLESLHAPRTVATVRARFAEPADDDEEEPSSSPRRRRRRLA